MIFINQNKLFHGIKAGDRDSIEQFYKKYYPSIRSLVNKNNGEEYDAKELFHSSFEVFYIKIKRGEIIPSKASLFTIFYTICKNKWHEFLRYKKRTLTTQNFVDFDNVDISGYDNENLKQLIETSIRKLDETCKNLLIAYYYHNMTMQMIAESLGFNNANTAKSKKNKCMNKLKKIVKDQQQFDI